MVGRLLCEEIRGLHLHGLLLVLLLRLMWLLRRRLFRAGRVIERRRHRHAGRRPHRSAGIVQAEAWIGKGAVLSSLLLLLLLLMRLNQLLLLLLIERMIGVRL